MDKNNWLNRGNRKYDIEKMIKEEEIIIKEHLENIKQKQINFEKLNSKKYKITLISQSQNTKTEININQKPKKFSEITNLSNKLLLNLTNLNYISLTPIQNIILTLTNENENDFLKEINKESNKKNKKNPFKKIYKDIIASSETGTGKTISYLIPIINTLIKNGPPKQKENEITKVYPLTLIILPTRELVEQVFKESKKLCFKIGINTIKIYGGINYDIQLFSLSQGCDILICTPGRLIDYLKIGIISLKYIIFFILDEADKLLDMGFEKQLNSIIFEYDLIDKSFRNNFLFSATFNESVIKIIRKFMNDYYFIQVCDKEINFIKQEFLYIKNEEKNKKIFEILKKFFNNKIIIFTNTKINSENLYNLIKNDKSNNFNIDLINGNKNQNERKKTYENFYNNKFNILIATDIIGRGLDFPNVDLIINYDIPINKEDYIHRIGRSGRMGNKGMSISFIDDLNNLVLKDIILLLNKNDIEIPNWMKNIDINNNENYVNLKKKKKKKKKKERSRSKDK